MSASWTNFTVDDDGQQVIVTHLGSQPFERVILPYRVQAGRRHFSLVQRPPRIEREAEGGGWETIGKPDLATFQHWCNYADDHVPRPEEEP